MIAYREDRLPLVQPMLFAKPASSSLMNSYRLLELIISHTLTRGCTYNRLVEDSVRLSPGAHDEDVVGGNNDYLIDALGLDLVQIRDIRRDMLILAGRREGARDSYENDLLVLELCMPRVLACP